MLPVNPAENVVPYATNAEYINEPPTEDVEKGVRPLDTLPAGWWNYLWNEITKNHNNLVTATNNIFAEIQSVLAAAGITPSTTSVNQLLESIQFLKTQIGNPTTAGAVRSSTDSGKIAIDSAGFMSVNGLGTPTSLNTTNKTVVAAINELLTTITNNYNYFDGEVTSLTSGKAPVGHAAAKDTYGKGTNTLFGHVKAIDDYKNTNAAANDGMVASLKALKDAYTELKNSIAGTASVPTGMVMPFAGAASKIPAGYFECNGQAVSRTTYAALFDVIGTTYGGGDGSTTFNVPDLRECVPVGAGTRGSGTTRHDARSVGQFADDTYQSHNHSASSSLSLDNGRIFGIGRGTGGLAFYSLTGTGIVKSRPITISSGSGSCTPLESNGVLMKGATATWTASTTHRRDVTSITPTGTCSTSIGSSGSTVTRNKQVGMTYIIKY